MVHDGEVESLRALRNFSGLDFCDVRALSVLKLAPGGHIGRLCIWTRKAFEALDRIFGSATAPSQRKQTSRNWCLPKVCMTNTDVERILSSDEV